MPDDSPDRVDRALMSFGDHLDELRKRVILAIAVPVPLAIGTFFVAEHIRAFLCAPAFAALREQGMPAQLQVLNPAETLSTDMQLALVVSLVLSAPWMLWQAWKFVEPGLYASEKRFVGMLVPLSAALTLIGLALLQWALLPLMLTVLVGFGQSAPQQRTAGGAADSATPVVALPSFEQAPERPVPGQMWLGPDHQLVIALPVPGSDRVELAFATLQRGGSLSQQFRLSEYLDFVLMLMLGTAVAFQLPLVLMLLGWIGIIETSTLRRFRRHAIFVCAILAALITPTGDPVSMVLMTVPLYGLYELGIILLIIAPPNAVAEGSVMRRLRDLALGRGRST